MKNIIIVLLFSALLCGCKNSTPKKILIDGFAQGTTYHIVYRSTNGINISKTEVDSVLSIFDKSCSLYDSTSLIVAVNNNVTDSLDANLISCIDIAKKMNVISGGLFDITVKPLTEAYGFLSKNPQESVNIDSILTFVGMDKFSVVNNRIIKSSPGVSLDMNAIAQGYAVDMLSDFFISKGVSDFLIELGGEIYCSGDNLGKLWGVGIDRPVDNNFVPGADVYAVIRIKDAGLTTSGNYRKFKEKDGKRINHTVNPKSGESAQNSLLSVTVVAANAAMADGYTTTFMLMGLEKSIEYLNKTPDIKALLIYNENDTVKHYITENLKQNITIQK